jgi:hypothetical protein
VPLEKAQSLAEAAVQKFLVFDTYDPNARWRK